MHRDSFVLAFTYRCQRSSKGKASSQHRRKAVWQNCAHVKHGLFGYWSSALGVRCVCVCAGAFQHECCSANLTHVSLSHRRCERSCM